MSVGITVVVVKFSYQSANKIKLKRIHSISINSTLYFNAGTNDGHNNLKQEVVRAEDFN